MIFIYIFIFFWTYLLFSCLSFLTFCYLNFYSYFFFIILFFFMHEPSCKIVCSYNFVPSCNFDPFLVKKKTRAKLTFRAKKTFCANLSSCNFIFLQFYVPVQEWLRAILSSCSFVHCAILSPCSILYARAFLTATQSLV